MAGPDPARSQIEWNVSAGGSQTNRALVVAELLSSYEQYFYVFMARSFLILCIRWSCKHCH